VPESADTLLGHGDFFNFHLLLVYYISWGLQAKIGQNMIFYFENRVFLLYFGLIICLQKGASLFDKNPIMFL